MRAHNFRDLTGQRFGKLIALELRMKKHRTSWLCKCDCGNEKVIASSDLIMGKTVSCTCQKLKNSSASVRTHGMHGTPLYGIWKGMKQRCLDKNFQHYHRYGGRGITICEKWIEFEGFYEDMHITFKNGLTLDRTDNDKEYSKNNCTWRTPKQQCNNKGNNRMIEYNGVVDTLTNHSERNGISFHVAKTRLKRGWSVEETFTTPVRHMKPRSA